MNEVFEKTRELGEAILRSEEYRSMKALEETAMQSAVAAELMGEYLEKKQMIEELLMEESPDVDELRRLSDEVDGIQQKMGLIGEVRALTDARTQFTELIDEVNKVLRFIITGEMGEDSAECEGGCDGCSGCGHLH